ncbi:MAG: hypothetical protein HY673_13920 [Chloroflexi bacterium]|nr:hypothetical protein [Chloroflexota bacterium]
MVQLTNRQLCHATRKDGQPCQAPALSDGFCFGHSPALAEKARQARLRGGQNKAQAVRLRRLIPPRLAPIFDRLEQVLDELHSGKLDPRIGSSMATVAAAMCRLLAVGELEERVRSLEESSKNAKR